MQWVKIRVSLLQKGVSLLSMCTHSCMSTCEPVSFVRNSLIPHKAVFCILSKLNGICRGRVREAVKFAAGISCSICNSSISSMDFTSKAWAGAATVTCSHSCPGTHSHAHQTKFREIKPKLSFLIQSNFSCESAHSMIVQCRESENISKLWWLPECGNLISDRCAIKVQLPAKREQKLGPDSHRKIQAKCKIRQRKLPEL